MHMANQVYTVKGYKILYYAESIVSKLTGTKADGIGQPILLLKNNLLIMYRYLGLTEKYNTIGDELISSVDLVESHDIGGGSFLSKYYHNVATIYAEKNMSDQAEIFFLKAIDVSNDQFNIDLVQTYNGLYQIYYYRPDFAKSAECCGKATEILLKINSNEYDHIAAMVANQFAMVYLAIGKIDIAAQNIHWSIKLYNKSKKECQNLASIAAYRLNAAIIYSAATSGNCSVEEASERHKVASMFIENAIINRLNLEIKDDKEIKRFYMVASDVYKRAGDMDHANSYLELFLSSDK